MAAGPRGCLQAHCFGPQELCILPPRLPPPPTPCSASTCVGLRPRIVAVGWKRNVMWSHETPL
eukprot:197086-Chlamydomonas_euryale.AAC.1